MFDWTAGEGTSIIGLDEIKGRPTAGRTPSVYCGLNPLQRAVKDRIMTNPNDNRTASSRLVLTITCDTRLTDSITDFVLGVLEAGVEQGVEDDLTEHVLHVYLEQENPGEKWVEQIVGQVSGYLNELSSIFGSAAPGLAWELTTDEDWGKNWQEYFKPFAIIPGLVIKPSWEDYIPKGDEKIIEMDPGMAFGTGHHATTSLCIGFIRDWLAKKSGATALDVGTGTGILAMAAGLFGAGKVYGIDNDPEAVAAADANVANNNLDERVTIDGTPIEEVRGTYSLVVANIIHDVLVAMLPEITRVCEMDGRLVLSGILSGEQAENIVRLYSGAGFELVARQELEEWTALAFTRR